MNLTGNKKVLFLTILVIAIGEFALDLFTPVGMSDWVLYFVPLFLSLLVGNRLLPYLLAGLFTILNPLGLWLSPMGVDWHWPLVIRLVGIAAFWLVARLLSERLAAEEILRTAERALKTIRECDQVLVRATNETELLEQMCRVLVTKGGYRMAWVGFPENDANKSVRFAARAGCDEGYLEQAKISWSKDSEFGRGPTSIAIRTGKLQVCNDFQTDPQVSPWREQARKQNFNAAIALPLRHAQANFGVLVIYAVEVNAFNPNEVELLAELADDLAYGLHALRVRLAVTENEALLKESQRIAGLGSYVLDIPAGQWRPSEVLEKVFGIDKTYDCSLANWVALVHPDERTMMANYFEQEVLGQRQPFNKEYRIRRHNDRVERWVHGLGRLEFDAQGRPVKMSGTIQDITDRKQAEAALTREQALLRTLVDHLPVALYLKDTAGRKTLTNPMDLKNFGLTNAADLLGKTDLDFFPPDQAAVFLADDQKVFTTGQPILNREEFITRPDGSHHWFLTSKIPLLDAAGKVTGLAGIALDITERRRAEQNNAMLVAAVEQADETFVITDVNGTILYVNPGFEKNTGYTRDEALGKNPRILKSGQHDAEFYRQMWATLTRGEVWHGLMQNRRKDKTIYTEEATISPILDDRGKIVNYVAVKRNVTEELAAAEKIRTQAQMLDLAHDAVTIRDLDNRLTYWNQSAERLYGWTRAEALGQDIYQLVQADQFKVAEIHRVLFDKGAWTGEVTVRAKDGREMVVESSLTLVRDASGQPKSVLAFTMDITERRKLEQQVARTQRIESLGTLAGGIAHDLNNILTPIMVSIDLLKEQTTDPMLLRVLASLDTSTQRGAQLVKQILTFGRGVRGERIPLKLRDIAREVQGLMQETFPKSIQFEVIAPDNLWPVIGDRTQLHQVILNLAINARDAMPNGGKLTFNFQNHDLDQEYANLNPEANPGPHVLIQVTDTGVGMSPEVMAKIFDPFFSTKPEGQGTGLGLSTTFGIVKSHGGFINVYSELGKGSTFKIYLPATATAAQTEQQAVTQTGLPHGNNELILFVDDEEAISTAVKKILERYGYRVLCAANGAEAISIYARQGREIAAVITDMHMPIMDGPATIIALQSMNPQIKIVGSSGLASNGGVAKAASSGVRFFVPKPYTAEKILRTLRTILNAAPETG